LLPWNFHVFGASLVAAEHVSVYLYTAYRALPKLYLIHQGVPDLLDAQ